MPDKKTQAILGCMMVLSAILLGTWSLMELAKDADHWIDRKLDRASGKQDYVEIQVGKAPQPSNYYQIDLGHLAINDEPPHIPPTGCCIMYRLDDEGYYIMFDDGSKLRFEVENE